MGLLKQLLKTTSKAANKPVVRGSLRPFEVIEELQKQFGISIKSVQQLNKLLQEMGLQVKELGYWRLTDLGEKYNVFSRQVVRPDLWKNEVVPLIAEYLKKKG